MAVGLHWFDLIPCLFFLPPILIGSFWTRFDADRRGQPGLLWTLLTIPLSWVAVPVYLAVRAFNSPNAAQ